MTVDDVIAPLMSNAPPAGIESLRGQLQLAIVGLDPAARVALYKNAARQLSANADLPGPSDPSAVSDEMLLKFSVAACLQLMDAQQHLMAPFKARVMSREPLVRDATPMMFTLAVSPESSANVNLRTGKRFDVVFAHMVFVRDGFLYGLVVSPNGFVEGQAAMSASPETELAKVDRNLMDKLYGSMVFTPASKP